MNWKRLLIYIEYTSILLSVLGAIVATNSGQVGLAAIPWTLALFFNLINRNQHHKPNLQIHKNDILLLQERLDRLDNLLQKQIQNLEDNLKTKLSFTDIEQVARSEITVIKQDIELIQDNLERLDNHDQAKDIILEERINNLNNWLQKQIQTLEDKLKIKASPKEIEQLYQPEINIVKQSIELIQNNLEQLHNRHKAKDIVLEERINNLNNLLQQKIPNLDNFVKNKVSVADIEQVYQSEVNAIKQSVKLTQNNLERLNNHNQTKAIVLEERIDNLNDVLQQQIQNLNNSLETKVSFKDIKQLERQRKTILTQKIKSRQDNLERLDNPNKTNELELAIIPVKEKINTLEDRENILNETESSPIQILANYLVEKEGLKNKSNELSQHKTEQLNEYLKQVSKYIEEIERTFTFFESKYDKLVNEEDLNNMLYQQSIDREDRFYQNSKSLVNTINLDEPQGQQKATSDSCSAPPKVLKEYLRENIFNKNKSKIKEESTLLNYRVKNSVESRSIFKNDIKKGINDITKGVRTIKSGVEEIGESIVHKFKT